MLREDKADTYNVQKKCNVRNVTKDFGDVGDNET